MAKVSANSDIVTSKGFTIARKGDSGEAHPDSQPHDAENCGKILVFFRGNSHGYWCEPSALCFHSLDRGKGIGDYIASKEVFDRYGSAPLLPKSSQTYEYDFGKNLRLCRRARRMSQSELGEKMGNFGLPLAQSTICYRENSRVSPGGRFVSAAAKALKVPAFVFFVPMDECDIFGDAKAYLRAMSSAVCDG
jgi:hypothetical protein